MHSPSRVAQEVIMLETPKQSATDSSTEHLGRTEGRQDLSVLLPGTYHVIVHLPSRYCYVPELTHW